MELTHLRIYCTGGTTIDLSLTPKSCDAFLVWLNSGKGVYMVNYEEQKTRMHIVCAHILYVVERLY